VSIVAHGSANLGPVAFVSDIRHPRLEPDDFQYARFALRLELGQSILISDGHGTVCRGRFGPAITLDGESWVLPPRRATRLAVAVTAGDRPEWIVAKGSELSIACLCFFVADLSVSRFDVERLREHAGNFSTIARHTAMMVGLPWLPTLEFCGTAREVPRLRKSVMVSVEGPPCLLADQYFVPPAGGWSDQETAMDMPQCRLAPHALSTETVALLAAAALGGESCGSQGSSV